LLQFKKYHPSGNLKCDNLGIFLSLKLRILTEKILQISLKLNFTPNSQGGYGLMQRNFVKPELTAYNNIIPAYGHLGVIR